MRRTWPEPVERVAEYVRAAAAEARIEEFQAATPTAEDAARAVGCELPQIVKSLVLLCDGKPIVVMVPGDRRADLGKVGAAARCERLSVAGPQAVQEETGFAPGAVAPFPLPRIDRIYIDRRLLAHERVWVSAGSTHHLAGLRPADLVRLARAQAIDAT